MQVSEETIWEGRPVLITWLPGYRPRSGEMVTQVSGLCFSGRGNILLVSEDESVWSLPGGKPEGRETREQTLRREIAEEACADVLRLHFMGSQRVEGLTPQPSYQLRYWARIRLQPFSPAFETRYRTLVSPGEYANVLAWGAGPLGQTLLSEALGVERQSRER